MSANAAYDRRPPGLSHVNVQLIMPNTVMVSAVWLSAVTCSG